MSEGGYFVSGVERDAGRFEGGCSAAGVADSHVVVSVEGEMCAGAHGGVVAVPEEVAGEFQVLHVAVAVVVDANGYHEYEGHE